MVYCICCNRTFGDFVPYGSNGRKAMCPFCRSLERHRDIFQYFVDNMDLLTEGEKNVLNIAPENIFHKLFSHYKNINYVPGDLNPDKFKFKVNKIDILNIPFKENYFDIILCSHVLEHIVDDLKAMKELYRVLKVGGLGILPVPINKKLEKTFEDDTITSEEERKKVFGQWDHVRIYGMDYIDRLESVGFKVFEENNIIMVNKLG